MTSLSGPQTKSSVWAFDLGKASIGEAVRVGNEFLHVESWLIPENIARRGPASSAGTPASRYRAMKTREAHRAREERLRAICAETGIETLAAKRVARDPATNVFRVVQEADPRLTREFPCRDENTCYTSCLLRIKLLHGEKLEGWQIFKALHSAIQRRGYDADLVWKNRSRGGTEDEEEGKTKQAAGVFRDVLNQMAPGHPEYHLPCFLDAWRLGLWSPEKSQETRLRINHRTEPARNRDGTQQLVAPRELVIEETRRLVSAAAKLFPKLTGRTDEILFGRGGRPYASYFPELRKAHGLRRGGANDWEGVLGQKVPRFDNRIIAKCALVPRLNVCKAGPRKNADGTFAPESLLSAEVTFLLKLKNARVQRSTKRIDALTAPELNRLFEARHSLGPYKYSFSQAQWKKALANEGLLPALGHSEIAAPRNSGRSRFCRPALRILRDLLLSGRSPTEQHALEMEKLAGNSDPRRGLVVADLAFLRRMGDSWTKLYVPDQQYDQLLAIREKGGRNAAIRALIGSSNNPVVRHRLEAFWDRLQTLEEKFGPPGEVVLEFVRQDFMGEEAKRKLLKFQNERTKAREKAREQAKELKAESRSAALKYELLVAQGFVCLYTGVSLGQTSLDELEIEHIVPRALGGPDAMVNYVVTTKAINDAKDQRTPYQWFETKGFAGWDAYVARVKERESSLRAKKVRLLTLPEAPELVQRYTALAETAYIALLAQTLVALHFGWPIRSDEGERRITVVNGGLTARVRRNYRLNGLLNPCPEGEDSRDWEEKCEKNRSDKRHHALDAMVISFIPAWARDPAKQGFFRLPKEVTRDTFAAALADRLPRALVLAKPELEATVYGERMLDTKRYGVVRVPFVDIATKSVRNKRVLKPTKDMRPRQIVDRVIRREVEQFLATHSNLALDQWDAWAATYRRGGTAGPRVKKILVTVTEADALQEYKEMAKDGTGQLRRGKQHRGYFIVEIPAPTRNDPDRRKLEVRPVYAHQSRVQLETEIRRLPGAIIKGFFESGCTVQIDSPVDHPKTPIAPGIYRLNSIWEQGNAVVTDSRSKVSAPIGLAKFIAAGFRRTT